MAYTGTSIVDYLNSTGGDASFTNRAKLAAQNGIQNYTGTAEQNTQLLGILNKHTTAPTTSWQQLANNPANGSVVNAPLSTNPKPVQPVGVQATTPYANISVPSTTLPKSQTVTPPNPNGLTNAQVAQGYSTVQGAFNPVTGQPWNDKTNPNPNTSAPVIPPAPTPPAPTQSTQPTFAPNNGLYGQLVTQLANQSQQQGQAYQDAMKQYNDINSQLAQSKKQEADALALNNSNPIPLEFQQGRGQVLQNQYLQQQSALGSQLQGASNVLSAANSQQGLLQQALQQAAGLAAPQSYGLTNQPYNPVTDQFTGGTSIGQRAANAGNVASIQDLTQQKNQIQSVFNGAEANFRLLVDTAKQGGVNDMNVPVLNSIQQAVAKGLTSASAVVNFQNTLATVRSQYAQILGGGTTTVDSQNRAQQAIPDNISLGALQALEQQLKAEATNRVAGIDQQIKSASGGTSNNNDPLGIL